MFCAVMSRTVRDLQPFQASSFPHLLTGGSKIVGLQGRADFRYQVRRDFARGHRQGVLKAGWHHPYPRFTKYFEAQGPVWD